MEVLVCGECAEQTDNRQQDSQAVGAPSCGPQQAGKGLHKIRDPDSRCIVVGCQPANQPTCTTLARTPAPHPSLAAGVRQTPWTRC